MHALHFPAPPKFKRMSHTLYFLLSLLPSCFICGWPNFQVWSILQYCGRLLSNTLTDRHKGISTSRHQCLRCAHYYAHPSFCKNELITVCLLALNQDPLLCLYDSKCRQCPSCSSITLSTVWSKERIGFTLTQWAAKLSQPYHRSQLTLYVTQGRQQTWEIHHVRKAEATLWRAIAEEESEALPWQLIHLTAS